MSTATEKCPWKAINNLEGAWKLKQPMIMAQVLLANIRRAELRTHRLFLAQSFLNLSFSSPHPNFSLQGGLPSPKLTWSSFSYITPQPNKNEDVILLSEPVFKGSILSPRGILTDCYCTRFLREKNHLNSLFSLTTETLKSWDNYVRLGKAPQVTGKISWPHHAPSTPTWILITCIYGRTKAKSVEAALCN